MCLDKLRRVRKNYKKYLAGHYIQCRSKNLFSEGRGKAVITRYNKLQCVTRCYKNSAVHGLVWKLLKSSFISKQGDKLLSRVTTSCNALQDVTKNSHVHYFQCYSRNIFSEGRGKAVATRYNKLQCVTRYHKNSAV